MHFKIPCLEIVQFHKCPTRFLLEKVDEETQRFWVFHADGQILYGVQRVVQGEFLRIIIFLFFLKWPDLGIFEKLENIKINLVTVPLSSWPRERSRGFERWFAIWMDCHRPKREAKLIKKKATDYWRSKYQATEGQKIKLLKVRQNYWRSP